MNTRAVITLLVLAVTFHVNESFAADLQLPKADKNILVFSVPEDQVILTNGTACFTVVATARKTNDTLYYQWQKNKSNIPGATEPSLIITNVQVPDVGFYTCTVSRKVDGPSIIVKGVDCNAPGAALFVCTSTNTAISGPLQRGSGTLNCALNYTGKVTFKVPGTQTTWFSRPAGSTTCVATDTTGLLPPYSVKINAIESYSLHSWCGVSPVTFSTQAPPTYRYQFTSFVTGGEALPDGTIITIDLTWP